MSVPTTLDLPGHWIGGGWTGARADAVSTDPAHPSHAVARFPLATADEVDAAVAAAADAATRWRRAGGVERGRVLRRAATVLERRAEQLARLVTAEEGKTLAEARAEITRAVDTLHYNAARALAPVGESFDATTRGTVARTMRLPVGVVAAVTPWNFPVAIPVWKLAPALAHGNTVVWKPSELTPAISIAVTDALIEAGAGDGVVNLVLGDGTAGRHLVAHPAVAAVTFTGSATTGRDILGCAGPRGTKLQLELGGHSPALVFDDADLDRAASHVVSGAMSSTGQKCTATRRVLVHERVRDELVDRIVEHTARLRVGPGSDPGSDLGPVVSAEAREKVTGEVQRALEQGGTALTGTDAPADPRLAEGHYVAPTVLAVDSPDLDICKREVFGPVTAVLTFEDDDEAFTLANATEYGLSAGVHTRSAARVRRALDEIIAGVVTVNGPTTGADLHVPFGGTKASSGPGAREMGEAAREFFTDTRTVYLDVNGIDS